MKKIFLIIFTLFFSLAALAENQRDLVFMWEDKGLRLIGHHRAYATIKVFEGEGEVGSGQADNSGKFDILLNLSKDEKHNIKVLAYDHFAQQIMTDEGEEDILETEILPGLFLNGQITAEDGVPVASAEIHAYDLEGNLLLLVTSDKNGEYTFANLPKGATIKIIGEEFDEEEFIFNGEEQKNTSLTFKEGHSPKIVTEKKTAKEKQQEIDNSEKSSSTFVFVIIGILLLITASVTFVIIKKKKTDNV